MNVDNGVWDARKKGRPCCSGGRLGIIYAWIRTWELTPADLVKWIHDCDEMRTHPYVTFCSWQAGLTTQLHGFPLTRDLNTLQSRTLSCVLHFGGKNDLGK